MSPHFAMLVSVPSAVSAGQDGEVPLREGLAARVAAGPGLWEDEDWLADLRRESLPESLLADGTIAAGAAAEHAHKQERALNAEVTALCLVTGALFPLLGYDAVLALVFGMPGLPARPASGGPASPPGVDGTATGMAKFAGNEAPVTGGLGLDTHRHSRGLVAFTAASERRP